MPAITVVEHDPAWAAAFAAERERVSAALGETAVVVEHIGSTAVPGLPAKPIVDIAVALPDMTQADAAVAALVAAGYVRDPTGDFGDRLFLRRLTATGAPTHHLSLTRHGSPYWEDHLAFRDALRARPDLCRRYGELKRRLAADHEDVEAYTRGKTALVREALLSVGHEPRSGWAAGL